jgi:putative tryptophan/tyrosine transport system substrate-binding protein
MIRRREFIAGLGSAAAWPLVARAQQRAMPVVGLLGAASAQGYSAEVAVLRQALRESGFIEGQNLAIEYRWAEDQFDRLPALADDLVSRRVAVIITAGGTATALAAKAATTTIPIVFALGGDPVRSGLVASLNLPGGNVTGVAAFAELLSPKRFQLARELAPEATVIAYLHNPNNPNSASDATKVEEAARAIGRQVRFLTAGSAQQFEGVFVTLMQERIGALAVADDTVFIGGREQLVALAARFGVPTIYPFREFIVAGGLMSYGTDRSNYYYQAGVYAGRILKGEKPADLPVMLPTKFELVINLKTAKALGVTIPETLLATADEVIQ